MHSRRLERLKQRFCCQLLDDSERHDGIVMDVTSSGLFVLTDAAISPGTQIEVRVAAERDVPEMTLRAIVVRHRLVRGESLRLIPQGLGLRILQAPDAYYELVKRTDQDESPCSPGKGWASRSRSGQGLGAYLRGVLSRRSARRGD